MQTLVYSFKSYFIYRIQALYIATCMRPISLKFYVNKVMFYCILAANITCTYVYSYSDICYVESPFIVLNGQ